MTKSEGQGKGKKMEKNLETATKIVRFGASRSSAGTLAVTAGVCIYIVRCSSAGVLAVNATDMCTTPGKLVVAAMTPDACALSCMCVSVCSFTMRPWS